jgi:RHS repeat-associated protein
VAYSPELVQRSPFAHDSRSALFYLRARYYDPSTAQFLSRDPLVSQTREPYGYVYDDPLNATDPTGLICLEFWDSSKCHNALTSFLSGSKTVGVCANVTLSGTGAGGIADVCGVVRFNGGRPVGFGTTETLGGGGSVGAGATGTVGVEVSNAQKISSLGGWFAYGTANGGYLVGGSGSVAAGIDDCHRPVVVGGAGVGPGAGVGGQVGVQYTWTQTWFGS